MTSESEQHKFNKAVKRNHVVANALNNLRLAQDHRVLQFKVVNERGHIRVWRFNTRDKHVDWWPYRRRAKLRCGVRVTRHRASNVDHILDILDFGKVSYD